MPKVHNWHIGRTMYFPHEAKYPKKQFAFVFNLNRCLGCQTCTMSCKSTWTYSKGQESMWWNNVETKPYGGYPRNWDIKILKLLHQIHKAEEITPSWQSQDHLIDPINKHNEINKPYGTYNGLTIFEAAQKVFLDEGPQRVIGYLPSDSEWKFPNIYEDTPLIKSHEEGSKPPEHANWFFYLPRLCNHCTYPACLAACPRNAIYKREEDGIVLIDQERCRGYKKCVAACPYKKPMFRPATQTSEKCIGCYPRIDGKQDQYHGIQLETRCMIACIGKIRLQGIVDLEEDGSWKKDPENPIYYLVKEEKIALPLYPQLGTLPNGYYIPPRWAPINYLRQMFGPETDEAIKKVSHPSRKLLGVMQLFRATQEIIYKFKIVKGEKLQTIICNKKEWNLYDDIVIGYNNNGKEIARVSVEEPFFIRPPHYYNSI